MDYTKIVKQPEYKIILINRKVIIHLQTNLNA